jgi:hypothetical protein
VKRDPVVAFGKPDFARNPRISEQSSAASAHASGLNGTLFGKERSMTKGGEISRARVLACPSAPVDEHDARVFGVVSGTPDAPEIAYLEEPVPLTPELRALTGELHPGEVFRVTSRCMEGRCREFANGRCSLGDRVVAKLPVASVGLPPCSIRSSCRWFAEQGAKACLRCPQVITFVPSHAKVVEDAAKRKRHLRVV